MEYPSKEIQTLVLEAWVMQLLPVALYQLTKGRCGFVDFALSVSNKRPKGVGPGRLPKPIQEAKNKKKWELALELLERSEAQ